MTWVYMPAWAFSSTVMWVDPKGETFEGPTDPRKDDEWYKGSELYAIFDGKEWKLQ